MNSTISKKTTRLAQGISVFAFVLVLAGITEVRIQAATIGIEASLAKGDAKSTQRTDGTVLVSGIVAQNSVPSTNPGGFTMIVTPGSPIFLLNAQLPTSVNPALWMIYE